jgi:2-methylcitrate dehydratase PrpD
MSGRKLSFAEQLGSFVVGGGPAAAPEGVRTVASRAFVDTLGCALAGTVSHIGQALLAHTRAPDDGPHRAPLFDGGWAESLGEGLIANSGLSHCLDYDDTNHPLYGHPSSVLVPVAAGLAYGSSLTGHELIDAYLVGHETEIALARAINHDHYGQGFHATGTLGVFGAAASAARLMHLDAEEAAHCLATAASLSCGLQANIGSMTKPLHAGIAAANGLRAARLVADGWRSSPDAFERPQTGYFAAYAHGRAPSIGEALEPLGSHWALSDAFGQQIKPFPACGATHPVTEAAIALHQRLGGDVARIRDVHAGVCDLLPGILVYDDPQTGDQARFSLTYAVARGLTSGRLGLDHFQGDAIFDVDVRAMMGRVSAGVDERVRESSEFAAILEVTTSDGETLEERVDLALGKNARPMTEAQLREKFDGCLAQLGRPGGDALWDTWRAVDAQPSGAALWLALAEFWAA